MYFKSLILVSCIALLLETSYAATNLNPQAFDPLKCAQDAPKTIVCVTDFFTNFGRPSAACCKALQEINDTCLPAIFPPNPLVAPFLKTLCSGATGGGGGAFPFPPLPFPFPPIGGGGAGGLPFPFPFPTPGVVGAAPPPKA